MHRCAESPILPLPCFCAFRHRSPETWASLSAGLARHFESALPPGRATLSGFSDWNGFALFRFLWLSRV
jgi:hypothetical protein